MPFHSARARRRAQAVVGVTATLGLLGVGPALSAAAHGSTPSNAVKELSMAAVSGVPANVQLLDVKHSLLGVHKWYQQMQGGYPVVGGMYAVHTDTTGPAKG